METVKHIIGLSPEEVSNIEELLVKEIMRINRTSVQHIVTFVLEHDNGDHKFPVLAQVSNIDATLWLNAMQLQNQAAVKSINVNNLRIRCQKAFKTPKVEAEIDKILDRRFLSSSMEVRNVAKNELVKLFLEI